MLVTSSSVIKHTIVTISLSTRTDVAHIFILSVDGEKMDIEKIIYKHLYLFLLSIIHITFI